MSSRKPFVTHEKSFDYYLKDLEKYPPLSREEEVEVARRARAGDEKAFEKLITSNLRFAVHHCKHYRNKGVPYQDLIQQANLGLIEAAHRFDPDRNTKFITYAVWWMKLHIFQCLGEEQGHIEACKQIGESAAAIDFLDDLLRSDKPLSPEAKMLAAELSAELANLIDKTLSPREAEIVKLYYGLTGSDPQTLMELEDTFRVSYERIRQIKDKALTSLKEAAKSLESFSSDEN